MNATPRHAPLIDAHGRPILSLRVSLLDACNLRCTYCMPEGGLPPAPYRLSADDLCFAVSTATKVGITRVRLTGGEPLLHPEVVPIVASLAHLGLDDLSLTTNGLRLAALARPLARAGLRRVNVSLDSLDEDRFRQITRRGGAAKVWQGIEAALDAGLRPVRVNTLLIAGFNEDELPRWVALTQQRPVTVRFLEVMPIGTVQPGAPHLPRADVAAARDRLITRYGLLPAEAEVGNGPARYWRVPGAPGMLGFITPLSEPYCNRCTRFRLTATGAVRPCLAQDHEVPLRDAILQRDEAGFLQGLREAAAAKIQGHRWREGAHTTTIMTTLGG